MAVFAVADDVTALLLSEIAAEDPTVVPAPLATVNDNRGSLIVELALLPKASVVVSAKDCTLVCATTAFRSLAPATIRLPVFLLPVVVAETVLFVAVIATVCASPAEDSVIPSAPFVCATIDESALV